MLSVYINYDNKKLAPPRLQWPGQQPRRPLLLPPKNRTSADKNRDGTRAARNHANDGIARMPMMESAHMPMMEIMESAFLCGIRVP